MGTRATTTIYNNKQPLVTIYRQMDGYWSGHGHELRNFLAGMTIVNGISGSTANKANGMGCLAAQLIARLKVGIGGIYITSLDDKEGYHYEISDESGSVHLKASIYGELGYDGPISDFNPEAEPCGED